MQVPSFFRPVLLAAILAGSLDLLVAILVYSVVLQSTTASKLVQSIASGVFGPAAYEGGIAMVLYGTLFHFTISLSFTAFYFYVHRRARLLRQNWIRSGIIYGIFIWIVMNCMVLPIVFSGVFPVHLSSALIGLGILVLAIGMPVSFIAHFHFRRSSR